MTGILYIVATPIGNLGDMTQRAIDTLKSVDIIACEDTRTSAKLLNFFNISTPTIAYHEHNADSQTAKLITHLQHGKSIALISDAGTPLISDPGYRLVKMCHDESITVVPVVGACAVIGALSASGMASDKFSFMGFLPAKQHGRIETLKAYQKHGETLIFYEAPHRIIDCLEDMVKIFGEKREATLCREISKTFETIKKASLADLLNFVKNDNNQQRGEIVLVVAGNTNQTVATDYDDWLLAIAKEVPPKKASGIVAEVLNLKKSTVYDRLLTLTKPSS
ncbi:16S rRNA (cytidine(1402)-2'-O)-methyltransferase [Moraxella sp. Tifton1]|uniref:16S rRNA (cytidine(1402)-2'-O)-methyltransferase n=1 Tax=Moraxella oculi TaxID=2940516 RepID=UPI002012BD7D|nr:16S rRNA (cytidine(1402)-2'-O)-methyltransferase [Moraxella sp. Tifton1]MCL1623145.1 16S rRNA (cytidine(1402)-2'-O)-methyltransferase [Moraxella sp. Tifton1]